MDVTVLGRYAPYAPPGGAVNGYLVRHGETAVLLDAGNGVAARLQSYLPIERLTAVVLSHLHEDHTADVHCLRFVQLAAQEAGRTATRLQVYAPDQPAELHGWLEGGDPWQELRTYNPEEPLVLGDLAVRFTRTVHPVPTCAMRITPVGAKGPVFFFTADTGAAEGVTAAACSADLLIVEAACVEATAYKRQFGHMTAGEAAAMARAAGAKRALLTHLWPGVKPEQVLAEGLAVHAGVELAEEGRTYRL